MFDRPLIPVLLAFITGILIGQAALPCYEFLIMPLFFSVISILLFTFFVPAVSRVYLYLLVFLLTGVLLLCNTKTRSYLLPLAQERRHVILEGTVLQPATVSDDIVRMEVKAERLYLNNRVRATDEKVILTVYRHAKDFAPGRRIRFPATLSPFKNFNNPGRYNYERAMRLKGFSCAASVSDGRYIVPMGGNSLPKPFEIMENLRRPIREYFRKTLSPENNALYRALVLGERQAIDPALREPFNATGLGHILAVSGLHIGLIATLSFYLLRWLIGHSYRLTLKADVRKIAAVLTCFPVVMYTCLAGFQLSGQRAMIMVLTYLFSILLGREKEVWSTLATAALLILALEPRALFSVSFQLSFVAVAGIIWLTPAIYKIIPDIAASKARTGLLTWLYLNISGLIIITFSATIMLLPLTTLYFHRISLVSIPANVTAVPLLGLWILPLGLLSSFVLHFSPSLANFLIKSGSWGLDQFMNLIRFWAHFNWSDFWVFSPNIFEIILYYLLIFFLFQFRRRPWGKTGLLIVLLIISTDISYWILTTQYNQDLKVTYIDVGQGNSALIRFPGNKRMLIDGGGFGGGRFNVGGMVVAPFLLHSKILRIDYLVLSHPQSDHMNGLRFMASYFKPREFWYNGQNVETPTFLELIDIVKSRGIDIILPSDLSKSRTISGVRIEILHPHAGKFRKTTDLNNNSLVLKLTYQGNTFLFPGDLESEGESEVIARCGSSLKSDILLVPHHGSQTSCSAPFLRMVQPKMCIISCGKDNYFGFPHRKTLKRLKNLGCRIIRIDKVGALQIATNKHHVKLKSYLGQQGY